jgi:hypothetical protein
MSTLDKLEQDLAESRRETNRLRDLKAEALEQSEQWRLAFLDADGERRRLEALVRQLQREERA